MSGSEHWPKGCPNGYSQHIATVENGCEIDFCVKAGAFSTSGLPPVRSGLYRVLYFRYFTIIIEAHTIQRTVATIEIPATAPFESPDSFELLKPGSPFTLFVLKLSSVFSSVNIFHVCRLQPTHCYSGKWL
jgi:hypothetical protein